MKTSIDWKLIQRYVVGSISPEDYGKLQEWMNQDPANKQLVQQVSEIWTLTPEEDFNVNVQKAWDLFSRNKMQNDGLRPVGSIQKRFLKPGYLYRAAIILVVLLTGFFAQYYYKSINDKKLEQASRLYVMRDLVTGKGEKARVTFSDGTEVTLNFASSLRFPKEFHGTNREVYLDGEAYFKVAHDPEHPFIVHVQDTKVQVLGTEFNIRGWSEDPSVDVAVRSGKVSVTSSDREQRNFFKDVILKKNQFTSVIKGIRPVAVKEIDIKKYLLWTRGGMYFDNVPFKQVLKDLERKYSVKISVGDPKVLKVPFTGTFRKADLNKVLNVIAASMGMEYTRRGSEIEFK